MKCPVCKSENYEEVRVRTGELILGGPSSTTLIAYTCLDCGTLFKEPKPKKISFGIGSLRIEN
jgi:hypothetical protein